MLSTDLGAPFRLLRRTPDLRLLLGAGLVSLTGDWLLGVGLAYAVYALTGSTLASAATLLSSFVPQMVVGSVAGVFVDRWDRKRTMVVANLLLAGGLLPLLLVTGADRIWVVYVVLATQSCVEVFFGPAEQAFLPRVVDDADLVVANGLNGQIRNVARLVGSGLGGVMAATGGIRAVAVADAVTFLVAAFLVLRIRTPGRARPGTGADEIEDAAEAVRGRMAALVAEWRDGFRTVAQEPVVRVLVLALLITNTGEGIMGTLFAPYVRHVLHGSGQVYGVITGVQAIGGIIGGFVVAVVAERWSPVTMVWAGSIVFGLVDLAIFLYPLWWVTPWPAALGMVLVGLPGAVLVAGTMTLFQRRTTDEHRGRVFSLMSLTQAVSVVVGSAAAGFLGDSLGIVPVLAVQGVGYVVAGGLVMVLLGSREPSLDLSPTRS
ncbi:MAG TPA: MFS transporter [Nocardioides sp.]|jgi:predicted MFS family arabinose efflux permease|nr:MFS transporter [Nocardioides sp.]